jgi:hypothetical protein
MRFVRGAEPCLSAYVRWLSNKPWKAFLSSTIPDFPGSCLAPAVRFERTTHGLEGLG